MLRHLGSVQEGLDKKARTQTEQVTPWEETVGDGRMKERAERD